MTFFGRDTSLHYKFHLQGYSHFYPSEKLPQLMKRGLEGMTQ